MTNKVYIGTVDWNSNGNHAVDFISESLRLSYFTAKNFPTNEAELQDMGNKSFREGTNMVTIALDYSDIRDKKYNYIIISLDEGTTEATKFYCFIDKFIRNSDNKTDVYFTIDKWQTYMFDKNGNYNYVIKDAFVQRQHEDRWTRGSERPISYIHPIYSLTKENLDTGEFIKTGTDTKYTFTDVDHSCEFEVYAIIYTTDSVYAGGTTINRTPTHLETILLLDVKTIDGDLVDYNATIEYKLTQATQITTYNAFKLLNYLRLATDETYSIFSESCIKIMKLNYLPFMFKRLETSAANLKLVAVDDDGDEMVNDVSGAGHLTGVGLWSRTVLVTDTFTIAIPKICSPINISGITLGTIYKYKRVYAPLITAKIGTPKSILYEPKLRTREYHYYTILNSHMDSLNIYEEYFTDDLIIKYANSMDVWLSEEIKLMNYKGDNGFINYQRTKNNNEITIVTDAYLNYMKNNRNQIQTTQIMGGIQAGLGVIQLAGGIAAGSAGMPGLAIGLASGGINQVYNGLGGIVSEQSRQEDYKNKADDVKSKQNELMLDTFNDRDFYWKVEFTIQSVYQNKIWDMFFKQGYLSNQYTIPDLRSRYYFNYIKCSFIELDSTKIGENDVRLEIEQMFLKGVTLWHYRSTTTFLFTDYTKENWEMSLAPHS